MRKYGYSNRVKTFTDIPLTHFKLSDTVNQGNRLKYTSILKKKFPGLQRPKARLPQILCLIFIKSLFKLNYQKHWDKRREGCCTSIHFIAHRKRPISVFHPVLQS
jgi:hypothetical protein